MINVRLSCGTRVNFVCGSVEAARRGLYSQGHAEPACRHALNEKTSTIPMGARRRRRRRGWSWSRLHRRIRRHEDGLFRATLGVVLALWAWMLWPDADYGGIRPGQSAAGRQRHGVARQRRGGSGQHRSLGQEPSRRRGSCGPRPDRAKVAAGGPRHARYRGTGAGDARSGGSHRFGPSCRRRRRAGDVRRRRNGCEHERGAIPDRRCARPRARGGPGRACGSGDRTGSTASGRAARRPTAVKAAPS